MKYVASVSFGKDSLAMLLLLIEKKEPLDEVIFYNTGMEFKCIYQIRDTLKDILDNKGIKFTELRPKFPFEYMMFDKEVKHRNGTLSKGYSWCGGRCRWGTTEKNRNISTYLKNNYGDNYIEYVGIASDETERINYENTHKSYPLVKYNMTEKDCLNYCYEKDFNWLEDGIELYSILDRVSCWCCANKNLKELKNYYKYLPCYWNKLKEFQNKTDRPFKNNKYTILDLEKKFEMEIISMTKEQEEFMIKNQKIDELCQETKGYGRMQFIDRIADLEINRDKLIKYLEDKIKELYNNLKSEDDENIRLYILHKRDAYQGILEKVRIDKYE